MFTILFNHQAIFIFILASEEATQAIPISRKCSKMCKIHFTSRLWNSTSKAMLCISSVFGDCDWTKQIPDTCQGTSFNWTCLSDFWRTTVL